MQTRDAVEGLHNYREFFQLLWVFRWGYGNTENVLYCFYKIFLKDNSTNEGKCWFFYFYIETDFLDTRSYFLPANQNARLTTHNQSKFVWCHNRVSILSSKNSYWPMRVYVSYPNYPMKKLYNLQTANRKINYTEWLFWQLPLVFSSDRRLPFPSWPRRWDM